MRIRKPKTEEQKAKDRERSKRRYLENRDNLEFRQKISSNTRSWQLNNPEQYMWGRSRQSALKYKVPFNIEPSDIVIPEECPIMKVPMVIGTRYTPSLDRIIPELGYVKGNVWVISKIANQMKSNSTEEERMKFSKYYLGSKS